MSENLPQPAEPPTDTPEAPPVEDDLTAASMTLVEHLDELRRRLIYALIALAAAMAAGLVFARDILALLMRPYRLAAEQTGLDRPLQALHHTDAVSVFFRVSLVAGAVLAAPVIFYQLWRFVSAGLYRHERKLVIGFVPFSAGLFVAGSLFYLFAAATPITVTLIEITRWMGAEVHYTLINHVKFTTNLMLVFGLAFQTPAVVLLLAKVGLVSLATLHRVRRHVVVAILIFAAVFTPPDPLSQVALAVPMWLLYELGVLLAWLAIRKRPQL